MFKRKYFRNDLVAGTVVFLVALPLCLGIALASGAPLSAGILAGIIGGLLVGGLTTSPLYVAGPAAGMSTIVLAGIAALGSFEAFLTALILSGIIQFLLGVVNFGYLGNFFPSCVIKGMMASIGLIIIFKQIPHGFGYDKHPFGEDGFLTGGENTFEEMWHALVNFSWISFLIFALGIGIMLIMQSSRLTQYKWVKWLPAPLLVVLLGIGIHSLLKGMGHEVDPSHMVQIPNIQDGIQALFHYPDFSFLNMEYTYVLAFTIALVGSLETVAAIEAVERLDPYKRLVQFNHELRIHGISNVLLGFIGGLPLTAVVVRSSANVFAGAKTKRSTIIHGFLILVSVAFIANVLNMIPLAALASILVIVGFRLSSLKLWKNIYNQGWNQFIPFAVTVLGVFFTNLLYGLIIGLITGITFVIIGNFHDSVIVTKDGSNYLIRFARDVSFLNKGLLRKTLNKIPKNSYVIIDGTAPAYIDYDIIETIEDYKSTALLRNVQVEIKKIGTSPNPYFLQNKENA